jgi:hypothetical protein
MKHSTKGLWKIAGLPKQDEHVIGEIRGEGGVV